MLRQNRYSRIDFIDSAEKLEIRQDEILISPRHGIVIALEPEQVERYEELKEFIMQLIVKIPELDNETQDFYEIISSETDFPHSLAIVYFDEQEVRLDYWSDNENNQFDVVFSPGWQLVRWNRHLVAPNWKTQPR